MTFRNINPVKQVHNSIQPYFTTAQGFQVIKLCRTLCFEVNHGRVVIVGIYNEYLWISQDLFLISKVSSSQFTF